MEPQALEAARHALESLARHEPAEARTAIAEAVALDPSLDRLADAVYLACSQLEQDDEILEATWNHLADAAGEGPLGDAVEQLRA